MDNAKYVTFLVIVLGTISTLGSPIKDLSPKLNPELPSSDKEQDLRNVLREMVPVNEKELAKDLELNKYPEMIPNRKELEALQMRLNQSHAKRKEDTEMITGKQVLGKPQEVDVGNLIDGASLTLAVLQSLLGDFDREIAIGVDNESDEKWEAINCHYYAGTSQSVLPREVVSGNALLYEARKTRGSWYGVAGVFTYHIKNGDKTLAVMFSVPYHYFWYSNWWNIKIYNGKRNADREMFNELYREAENKGDNSWKSGDLKNLGLKFKGYMNDAGKAILQIKVHDC